MSEGSAWIIHERTSNSCEDTRVEKHYLEEVRDATEAHIVTAEEGRSAVKDHGNIVLVPAAPNAATFIIA